jgi:murein DD-endopeptidase MepM/ murein hydrolase activator NlpD
MCNLIDGRNSFRALRWGFLSAVAIGAAACSPETARFSDNSLGNPYGAQPSYSQAAPPPIERQPLPPNHYGQPQSGQPLPPPVPETTGTVRSGAAGSWDWEGGTAITLERGDTIGAVSHRFGVPVHAIMEANHITDPKTVAPGQRIVIPRYNPNGTGAKLAHAAAPRTPGAPHVAAVQAAPQPAATPRVVAPHVASAAPASSLPASAASGSGQTLLAPPPIHTVMSGDTLSRIAHKYHVKVKDLAVANGIQPETPLKIGDKITVPVKTVAAAPKTPQVAAVAGKPQPGIPAKPTGPAKPGGTPKVAANDTPNKVQMVAPAEAQADETGTTANGAPAFRWPIRGRVIANFGSKVNGASNDGIDLAVPEGTPIRSADDGVVAYSGSELKGYGNLVLVRHANGFVTAYAHASELMVKRNDQVHKGQVIAKSGQTGTATTPQLHFEVRKNSAPVDPMQYLPSDKTASAPL